MDEERKEYLKEYRKENIRRVSLDLRTEQYATLTKHINTTGESMNGFIKRAIKEQIKIDKSKKPDELARIEQDREMLRNLKGAILAILNLERSEDDADR